jgi:hypothetical protein
VDWVVSAAAVSPPWVSARAVVCTWPAARCTRRPILRNLRITSRQRAQLILLVHPPAECSEPFRLLPAPGYGPNSCPDVVSTGIRGQCPPVAIKKKESGSAPTPQQQCAEKPQY